MHAHVSLDPNDMADDVSSRDIEVQVFNETDDDNIIVLVFARRYPIPLTKETMRMAWKILKIPSKGNVKFTFPLKNSIGAFYYDEENHVSSEPFEAEPGSTWIATTHQNRQMILEQVGMYIYIYIYVCVISHVHDLLTVVQSEFLSGCHGSIVYNV